MAGAAGALGIAVVGALGRATPALAGTDGDVVLGSTTNSTTQPTWITNTGSSGDALVGIVSNGSNAGVGGSSNSGPGVEGISNSGPGVSAYSTLGDAVFGTVGSSANAVHGQNTDSGAGGFGVFGEHMGGGVAIQGNSLTSSTTSTGVLGYGQRGVYGLALFGGGGTGVVASSALDGTGVALEVIGPATFTGSGIVSIVAGKTSSTVTGVPLTASSLVLATVQNNAGVSVAYVVPSVSGSSFVVHLNKAVPVGKTAKVGWFVVN
jgi:hypothetical protein